MSWRRAAYSSSRISEGLKTTDLYIPVVVSLVAWARAIVIRATLSECPPVLGSLDSIAVIEALTNPSNTFCMS